MSYRGAIVDLDGTVYRGRTALPGATTTIERFRDEGLSLLFLSNNPTKTRSAYVDRLGEFGIDVDASEVLSAGTITTRYLREHHPTDAIYCIGSPGLREQFADADLLVTDDPETTDVLVASWSREFDYDAMTAALRAVDDDTVFIGSDPDRTVPASDGRSVPGSGAIIGAVAAVTDRDPDKVMGKPSPEAVSAARDALDVPLEDCLLVGDRLNTDVALGERAGMTTVLVLTGSTSREAVESSDVTPDYVLDSLADVPSLLD